MMKEVPLEDDMMEIGQRGRVEPCASSPSQPSFAPSMAVSPSNWRCFITGHGDHVSHPTWSESSQDCVSEACITESITSRANEAGCKVVAVKPWRLVKHTREASVVSSG